MKNVVSPLGCRIGTLVALIGILLMAEPAFALRRVAPNSPSQVQLSFSPIVKMAAPAVVNIYTKRRVQVRSPTAAFYDDPVLRRFMGQDLSQMGQTQERVVQSLGSGVIVHENGIAVTSSHVVEGSDEIIAVLNDKREYPAQIVFLDKDSDLAVLKLETGDERLPFLRIASSGTLEVGDMVLAIGNPFGVGQTVTSGIVSALGRPVGELSDKIPKAHRFIQTDAAINPGNSGGALVNMEGKLVGINAAIFSQSGGSHGIGFAIPAEVLVDMLQEMLGN
jgi:serine protease Do